LELFERTCQKLKTKREIKKRFGKLASNTFKKICEKGFVTKNNSAGFLTQYYRKIYSLFSKHLYNVDIKKKKYSINHDRLKDFMKCLPSVKTLAYHVSKIEFKLEDKKDIIFIKFFMELIEHYLMKFDFPLYNVKFVI
jgi:hypothetical protein